MHRSVDLTERPGKLLYFRELERRNGNADYASYRRFYGYGEEYPNEWWSPVMGWVIRIVLWGLAIFATFALYVVR